MSLSRRAMLLPEMRAKVAEDPHLGGGNLLRYAMSTSPDPNRPFIRSGRPLVNTSGQQQSEFSLVDLDKLAQSWSVWYLSKGVGPRDRVAIYFEDTFAYSIHFYALSQIGAIPVLINSKAPGRIAMELCRRTKPIGLYTDKARLQAVSNDIDTFPDLRWIHTIEELPAPEANSLPEGARFWHSPEDPVVILHSSGTTGMPKPVTHTHGTIVAGPRYRLAHYSEPLDGLMMAAQPQSHVGFIGYATYAILAGTPMVALYDPTGPEMAAAIEEHRPTMVMAFAHAFGELAALDVPQGSLDSVVAWITMGDAVHEAHIKAILCKRSPNLCEPSVFYDRFGSSELGWGLMVQPWTLSSKRSDRRVGKPDSLAEFVVLHKDGRKAGVNEIGLFGVKSPTITVGYWNDSDTTYRTKLAGYWLTGDVGYRDEEGYFFQVDRAVDVIETSTKTGYSVLMEEVLLSEVSEITDCAVVAGKEGDKIVPVAVVRSTVATDDQSSLLAAANHSLRAAGHPELAHLEVVESEEDYPVGVTGKVLKRQLRERYTCLPPR